MTNNLSRRAFTRGSLGALAAAAVGAPLLSGCNSGKGAGTTTQGTGEAPAYVRYAGPKPDLAGTDAGIPDAYFTYPSPTKKAFDQPPGDGKPVTAMGQTSEPIPPALDKNAYWQELNKHLGSDLKMAMTPATDYDAKFATVVAGEELPDIFQVSRGANAVPQLMQAKALDLTDYLAGDAINDYPMLANIPTPSWGHAMFSGKIYAIPVPRGVLQSTIQYQRQDLLEAKGITAQPKSFQEYFDICKEVTEPKKNTWALTSPPLNYIQQMLKVPNGWKEEGGKLTNGCEVEEIEESLEAARKMFEAGVIVPDSYAVNATQYKQWFLSGQAYFTGDSYSAWPAYYSLATGKKSFELSALDMPGYDGGAGSIWLRSPTHSIVAINKTSKDRVKTLLSVMNWLAAPFGTDEFTFRKYGVKGEHYQLKGTDPTPIKGKLGETFMGIQYLADAPTALYLPGHGEVVKAEYEQMTRVIPTGTPDPTEALYSETKTRSGSKLSKKLNAIRDEIVQGRRPVSEWATAVDDWRQGGGDKMRTELEEALQQQ